MQDSINESVFFDLVNFDYCNLIKLLLNNKSIDINMETIFNVNFHSISLENY